MQHRETDRVPLFYRDAPDVAARLCRDLGVSTIMAPGGGFFLGPTHNFQADIPTANIVAMYQAARER